MIREELQPVRATRSQDESQKVFWQDILDPESIMKNASKSNMEDDSNSHDPRYTLSSTLIKLCLPLKLSFKLFL